MSSKKKASAANSASAASPSHVSLPALGSPRAVASYAGIDSARSNGSRTAGVIAGAQTISNPKPTPPAHAPAQATPRTKPAVPSLPISSAAAPIDPGFSVSGRPVGDVVSGVTIKKVQFQAGLQVGDIIQMVNGHAVGNQKEYNAALASSTGRLVLKVLRDSKLRTLAVEYGPQTARQPPPPAQPPQKPTGSQTVRAPAPNPATSDPPPAALTSPRTKKVAAAAAPQQPAAPQSPAPAKPAPVKQASPPAVAPVVAAPAPPAVKPPPPAPAAAVKHSPKPAIKVLSGPRGLHEGQDAEIEEEGFEGAAPTAAEIARAQAILAAAAKATQTAANAKGQTAHAKKGAQTAGTKSAQPTPRPGKQAPAAAPNTARVAPTQTKPAAAAATQSQSNKKPTASAPVQQAQTQKAASNKKPAVAATPAAAPAQPTPVVKSPRPPAVAAPSPAKPAAAAAVASPVSPRQAKGAPPAQPQLPAASATTPRTQAAPATIQQKSPATSTKKTQPTNQQHTVAAPAPAASKKPVVPAPVAAAPSTSNKKAASPAAAVTSSPAATQKKPPAASSATSPPAPHKKPAAPTSPAASNKKPSGTVAAAAAPTPASPPAKKPVAAPAQSPASPSASHKKPSAASPPAAAAAAPQPASPNPSPRKTTVIVAKKSAQPVQQAPPPPPKPITPEDPNAHVDLDEPIEGEEEEVEPTPVETPVPPPAQPSARKAAASKQPSTKKPTPKNVQGSRVPTRVDTDPTPVNDEVPPEASSVSSPASFTSQALASSVGLSVTGSSAPTPRMRKPKPVVSDPSSIAYYHSTAFLVLPEEKKDQTPRTKKAMVRVTPAKSPRVGSDKKKSDVDQSPASTNRPLVQRVHDDADEDAHRRDPVSAAMVAHMESRSAAISQLIESVNAIEANGVEHEKNAIQQFALKSEAERKKALTKGVKVGSSKKKSAPRVSTSHESKEDGAIESSAEDDLVSPAAPLSPPKEHGSLSRLRPTREIDSEALKLQKFEHEAQVQEIKRTRSMNFAEVGEGGLLAFAMKQKAAEEELRAAELAVVEALKGQKDRVDEARAKLNQAKRYLGIEIIDVTSTNPSEREGVKIVELKPDGTAIQAKLRVGDTILSLNGVDTPTRAIFGRTLKTLAIGSLAQIKFRRPADRRGLADTVKTGRLRIGTTDLTSEEVETLNGIVSDESIAAQFHQLKNRSTEQHLERVQIASATFDDAHATVFTIQVNKQSEVRALEHDLSSTGDLDAWKKLKIHLGLEVVDVLDRRASAAWKVTGAAAAPAAATNDSGAMRVSKIFPGEAAQKAGIKLGDLIIMCNSHPTTSRADFEKILRGTPRSVAAGKSKPIRPGDELHFVILRAAEQKKGPGMQVQPLEQFTSTLRVGAIGMPLDEVIALRQRVDSLHAAKTKLDEVSKRSAADQAAFKQSIHAARTQGVQAPLAEDETPMAAAAAAKSPLSPKSPTIPNLPVGPLSPRTKAARVHRVSIVPEFRPDGESEPTEPPKPRAERIHEDEDEQ